MLEQGERLSLAQAFDGIRAEFGVSDTALGALAAAMVLVGVVGGLPMGALADRWRRSTLLVIAMVIWTACMGFGASWMDVLRELLHIRSMWFGLMSLTISSFLLSALGVWGIEFFKQAFDLSATKAGAFVPAIGAGAAIGLVGGGELADRLLRRGMANARVYVTAVSSVLASVLLLPAFLTSSLPVAAVLLFFGSLCLTTPVAPSEALVSDVVPGELRGRAAAIRSVVRALSALAPLIVGVLSDATDLPTALAMITPLYAVGGLVMLLAARTYPADLAFVAAEARRTMAHSRP